MTYNKVNGKDLPGHILIQVVESADPTKIVKQGEKDGLHNALSMGIIWLDRANRA
jgi:hypothetical protein